MIDVVVIADLFLRQYGGTLEDAEAIVDEWQSVFTRRGLSTEKVKDAMMRVLEEGPPLRKDTRLSAILKACGSSPKVVRDAIYCDRCKGVGGYTVPHDKDWTLSRHWQGRTTMWVRCMCSNGDKFGPCTTMDFYESRFPNWREEYPLRYIEWQMMRRHDEISRLETDGDPFNQLPNARVLLAQAQSAYDKIVSPVSAPAPLPVEEVMTNNILPLGVPQEGATADATTIEDSQSNGYPEGEDGNSFLGEGGEDFAGIEPRSDERSDGDN